MDFFHSLPVPELWEWIFFIPFPFPNYGNGFSSFPSRSRISGMLFFLPFPFPNDGNVCFFFHSLPVPQLWEWILFIPFPFPKCENGFFNSLPIPEFALSQWGIKTGNGITVRDTRPPIFSVSSTFLKIIILRG